MIPVIIILPDGSSFNYFNKDINCIDYKGINLNSIYKITIGDIDNGYSIYTTQIRQLRDTVLQKLHKAVPETIEVLEEKGYGENCKNEQVCIKIYLKDIIAEAEKELKKQDNNTNSHHNTGDVKTGRKRDK